MFYPNKVIISGTITPDWPVSKVLSQLSSPWGPVGGKPAYGTDGYPVEPNVNVSWDTDHWALDYSQETPALHYLWARYDADPEGQYVPHSGTIDPPTGNATVTAYEPIIERITRDIANSINAITIVNGFNQDLTVVRPNRLDFVGTVCDAGRVFLWKGDQQEVAEPSMAAEWLAEFYVYAEHVGDDQPESGSSIETNLNITLADIEKKLKEDVTRGGLAIDTLVPKIEQEINEENAIALITVQVHYRTLYTDPYTQI